MQSFFIGIFLLIHYILFTPTCLDFVTMISNSLGQ
jgi:hypothetical protein